MKTIPKHCLKCSKEFQAPTSEVKRGNAKFCSLSCAASYNKASQPKQPNTTCALCGKHFYRNTSRKSKSKSGLHFCCRAHKDQAQRIGGLEAIQPSHYGNGEFNYRVQALREYPHKCKLCGYDKYSSVLRVHHIDGDRTNNTLTNLAILCPTCHVEIHLSLSSL